jgi:hypothetical protein
MVGRLALAQAPWASSAQRGRVTLSGQRSIEGSGSAIEHRERRSTDLVPLHSGPLESPIASVFVRRVAMSTDLRQALRELFENYRAGLPDVYRFEDERDRWYALVASVMSEQSGLNPARAESVTQSLADLQLLEPAYLTKGSTQARTPQETDQQRAALLIDVLVGNGVEVSAARESVLTICQLAEGISGRYGKLQTALRTAAETLRRDLIGAAGLSHLRPGIAERIVGNWLQNALELPIPVVDRDIEEFCRTQGCTVEELTQAADAVDVGLAVVDDLIRLRAADVRATSAV